MYCGRRHYSLSRISLLRTPDRDRDSNRAMDLEGDQMRITVNRGLYGMQDSALIYDIGDGVALFTPQISVVTRSDRDRGLSSLC